MALPFALRSLSIATWNARGLFMLEARAARKKLGYLKRMLAFSDIVLVQESHGSEAQWGKLCADLRNSHRVYFSVSEEFRQGGLGFFVKRNDP